MISRFFISSLERLLNSYLNLDPATPERLNGLLGQVILLQVIDYSFNLYFLPTPSRLNLATDTAEAPTLVLRGRLRDFLLSINPDVALERKANQLLVIEGDTDKAQVFRALLKHVSIDWEEHLSHYLGDTIAHQICYQANKLISFGRSSARQFSNDLAEYLQHEIQLLPSRLEVEDFYSDIYSLQEDVARLAAKIELISKKKKKKNR